MQVEPYENKSGYRVWLSKLEEEQLLEAVDNEPKKKLAVQLGLHGLRADEITRVSFEDFRQTETEKDGWMLHVWQSKTSYRECPISAEVVKQSKMMKNMGELRKDEQLINKSKRTIQRWVKEAAESVSEGDKHWEDVTSHDLRRTWATRVYWSLNGSRAREIVMAWGGWDDVQTFTSNYLGKIPDDVAIEVMQEAGIV